MHESALMRDLLRRIEAVARAERARRVTAATVRLGALNPLSPEHLAGHFAHASAGTIAAGARLTITVSDDMEDADAQAVLLESVELEI
jgi:Zn finger protein HypA/HybF involved in hydrogenase expression